MKKNKYQKGQATIEYLVVCLMLVFIVFFPINDKGDSIKVVLVKALRDMHEAYMFGISMYATPF